MDSFFASAEQHLRPELRGQPVGVVPVATEHTSIIAASRDAKRVGVKVGTPVREARRLCPGIEIVKARPAVYVLLHEDILKAVDTCAPVHKVYSIDEWSIRLAPNERTREGALALGAKIQRVLRETFSPCLSGSVGVAPTRLLAKIASDLEKPSGLVALDATDLPQRLSHLELDDLPGIAAGMRPRLEAAGVRTIADLWRLTEQESRAAWGSVQGQHWWLGFHGHDVPEPATKRHSMGHGHVLPPEHRNDAGAHGILVRLITKGAWRLRHHNYCAHRLHVSITGRDGPGWHAQAPLESEQDTMPIL
ncbi:MAG: type VI secretion protein ImpB, partial [Phycisphaerales bacterium]